jgi:hypothetical protein
MADIACIARKTWINTGANGTCGSAQRIPDREDVASFPGARYRVLAKPETVIVPHLCAI